jgi:threonine dehydratase
MLSPDLTTFHINIPAAAGKLKEVVKHTPLMYNHNLSRRYQCNVYLKREDMQVVRSYKLRGAYNMMSSLSTEKLAKGVVCASAGNHAQGVAYSCKALNVQGVIFMPVITPRQKIKQVEMWGAGFIKIVLTGDTFDECAAEAIKYAAENGMTFIPPFDHPKIIEGQGTVALEILEDLPQVDYLLVPIGGGGLAAGAGTYFKSVSPQTQLLGVEPEGAPTMHQALAAGEPVVLERLDRFVDGAAVKRAGNLTFQLCKEHLDGTLLVPEGKVCTTILKLYNEEGIVVEPAGALTITALDQLQDQIKGKNVVCVISGSNNDIDRMQEIKERSLLYEGLKHYFVIGFAQRPGALKEFVNNILGPGDDITRFEYVQKHNKETGPALVGIELNSRNDYEALITRLGNSQINYREINKDDDLFGYLI